MTHFKLIEPYLEQSFISRKCHAPVDMTYKRLPVAQKTSCSNVQEVIYIYELLFFGKIKFNIIAVIVASTTGDLPKIVVTQDGKVASAAFA